MIDPTDTELMRATVADKAKTERLDREVERAELKRLLSSQLGRTFVMRQIERAGVFRLSLAMDATELTHLTAFNEGRRNEGLRLLSEIIESCPELWAVMLRERAERAAAKEQQA